MIAFLLSMTMLVSCDKDNNKVEKPKPKEQEVAAIISVKTEGGVEELSGARAKAELEELLKAYKGKALEELSIAGKVLKQNDLDYIKTAFKSIALLDLKEATISVEDTEEGFKSSKTIKQLILPKNLKSVGFGQLAYTDIEEVIFSGDKLESIGEGAFALNKKIKSLNLPSSLLALEKQALGMMTALESIEIPENVRIIPDQCFFLDKALKSVTFKGKIHQLGDAIFSQCANLTMIKFSQKKAPKFNEKEWPFVEAEFLNNEDGMPRLHFYIPKGSLQSYLKTWRFDEEKDKAYFIEY